MADKTKIKKKIQFDIRTESGTIILILMVLFVLNLLFFLFLTRPAYSRYWNLSADNVPALQALEQKEKETEIMEKRFSRINETENNINEFYQGILATKDERMIDIQLEVVDIAAEFSIDPDTMKYGNEELLKEEVEKFTISVPLVGTYANLRNFLQKIENSDNFLIVDRVFLTTAKEGGVILQLNIQLSTFFDAPYLKELTKPRKRI
jgi:Tfp pilus assembly protein PilO